MRVVALDLSLTGTGVCFPDGTTCTWSPRTKGPERLATFESLLYGALASYQPDLVVLEDYAYAAANQAHQVGELGGVVRLALHRRRQRYVLVNQASVKRYACGKGNAKKESALGAAVHRFGREFANNNESDARWLHAMAMDHYGQAPVQMPQQHRAALDAVAWPTPPEGARSMTDTPTTDLGEFEGRRIAGVVMNVRGLGDGLSESMKTDPVVLHVGDEVVLVVRGRVKEVRFPRASKDAEIDDVKRCHEVAGDTITLIDSTVVAEALAAQERRNADRRAREKGQEELDGVKEDADAAQLDADHRAGDHADGMVVGCPGCDEEWIAEGKEARETAEAKG